MRHKLSNKKELLVDHQNGNNKLSLIKQKELVNEIQSYETLIVSAISEFDYIENKKKQYLIQIKIVSNILKNVKI